MKKGFYLIEVIIGLFLLGLITVSILPLNNIIIFNLKNQKHKYNMLYIAEMAIERILSYNNEYSNNLLIYDVEVGELIKEFNKDNYVEILLDKDEYEYPIKIIKNDKSDTLWHVRVLVYNKSGEESYNVELKAYIPKK